MMEPASMIRPYTLLRADTPSGRSSFHRLRRVRGGDRGQVEGRRVVHGGWRGEGAGARALGRLRQAGELRAPPAGAGAGPMEAGSRRRWHVASQPSWRGFAAQLPNSLVGANPPVGEASDAGSPQKLEAKGRHEGQLRGGMERAPAVHVRPSRAGGARRAFPAQPARDGAPAVRATPCGRSAHELCKRPDRAAAAAPAAQTLPLPAA